ncbi:MAG: hypothetical protein CO073_03330 [Candidatus Komeilibacteria bacterium CG_4_9_14_0_8_um_filter_36_9]|uniref:DUF2268 domain-containing protein n=1 Tax=Candidatus Komeilibacteria bacterium CG_4_9_14_0_8_um_filter_36_9 TaxID=1974473 RepID=A0A2M8DQQ6_9BACT|nr:MAG: hypothetical protein CO073_03330 [Candidatus Komeilibacteria bacterium CG_4_9_14_0_8_um_filter_36_9]
MNIPKVKFTDIPISKEVDWIHGFLFQNEWGWGKHIIKKHPKIKKVFSFKTEEEQVKFLRNYIIQFKKDNQKLIEKNKIKYQIEWQKIEKDFLITLSEIIQINWPKNKKIIKAMASINPICPRFLNDWSFSIFYNYKKMSHVMEVIMHESCHFLYFEKWKKLYPKVSNKKFESPHIEWHLSEIIAPIILNDQKIKKILKQKAVFYEEHEIIKINNKTAPEYFAELYNKNKDFEQFLDKSYKAIKKNKNLFNDK